MATWQVRLEGHQFDLADLADDLQSPEATVSKDGENFYLHSSCFDGLTDAAQVLAHARAALTVLHGAARIYRPDAAPVRVGTVTRQRDDGARDQWVFASSVIETPRARQCNGNRDPLRPNHTATAAPGGISVRQSNTLRTGRACAAFCCRAAQLDSPV